MKKRILHVPRAHAAHVLGRSAQRTTILCLAILAATAAAAQATPRIDVGSHTVGISPLERIDVFVTGGDPLQGIDIYVSIADEGNATMPDQLPGPADAGEPKIVSVDIVTGTVFNGNSTRVPPGVEGTWQSGVYQSDQVWELDTTTGTGADPAEGKIFTIILDTTGVAPGSMWPLRVLGVLPNFFGVPLDSSYSNWFVKGEPFDGTNGSFTVGATSSVVPEPASAVLAVLAVVGLGARCLAKRLGFLLWPPARRGPCH